MKHANDSGLPVFVSEGNKVFSAVRVAPASEDNTPAWIEFELRTDMPGSKKIEVGNEVTIKRSMISGNGGSINEVIDFIDLAEVEPTSDVTLALYLSAGSLVYRVPYFTSEVIPVISINNERIGLPYKLLAEAF